jgi:hypothetical protein
VSLFVPSCKAHGWVDIREHWTISDAEILDYLDPEQRWIGLRGIGMVRAQRGISCRYPTKRLNAGWDTAYLQRVLAGVNY